MKKIASSRHFRQHGFSCAALLLAASLASCDLSDDNTFKPIIIIEPPTGGFVFDEDSIPRCALDLELGEEEQQCIRQEVIGHGWRWLHSYEINDKGCIVYRDYYATHPQARSCNYYFPSDSELTTYSYLDGITTGGGYYNWDTCLNYSNGDVSIDMPGDKFFLLNIVKVFELDGQWYMATIERLGMNGGGLGMINGDFACSEYVRMTDDELAQYQHEYTLDWQMVNIYTGE